MDAAQARQDYKDTLKLPRTDFPMKADLARREPEILARWAKMGLYDAILAARADAPPWVLHDGPPYANGNIHYGHILNKVLKDVVVKSRTMLGHHVAYTPGWDCHGLPIELAVMRELGERSATLSPVEIRRACHDYAMKWVGVQRDQFRRLGVFGSWDAPYLTLDRSYEATVIRQLASFARQGLLFREQKPVHWCCSCKTALAEAEIEYDEQHRSPSIYVKFALPAPGAAEGAGAGASAGAGPGAGPGVDAGQGLYAVIWTTTPWTLPANWAIAYNPAHAYVALRVGDERYVVVAQLADAFLAACGLTSDERAPFPVERFAEIHAARHPFIDRPSLLLPADHVTLEAGTGLVHTAPGHGADDYVLGKKHGLPVDAPVDDGGRFTRDEGDLGIQGKFVHAANPVIIAHLHETRALLSSPKAAVVHAYPICWRCKNPVIFRSTWQWFAALDPKPWNPGVTLRQQALTDIGRTAWVPPWGENRIRGMIESRPDWVLSRQRIWGVPIPVFYRDGRASSDGSDGRDAAGAQGGTRDAGAGEAICDADLMEHIAGLVERDGVDAWFAGTPADLLPPGSTLDPTTLRKGQDIVDVWFESGVSWAAVCEGRPGLDAATADDPRPIDLYLEGSDQHRGWFHSALLTSAATRGRAPYRAVLTHGFVLDERGRPYSKSEIEKARREGVKIEFIPPEEVIKTQGAELLRLWTAAADFRNDVAYSRAHLTQLGESYRKLRNTVRFLLGNLDGYVADTDGVAAAAQRAAGDGAPDLERYLYVRLRQTVARAVEAYRAYELHVVVKALVDLCVNDLSSLFLDVRKDRLYCDPAASPGRRRTQLLLELAARQLALLAAPVLAFSADEIWSYLPRRAGDPASVHLALFEELPALADEAAVLARWERLLAWRRLAQSRLEPFRAAKHASLDAVVTLVTAAPDAPGMSPENLVVDLAELADLFIVSGVTVERAAVGAADDARVAEAPGVKCARCWKYTPDAPLCARCNAALAAG